MRKRASSSRAIRTDSPDKGVLFETGYGPSGLPHIGTFGEVVRTTWCGVPLKPWRRA